jgi:hypothetical protein
MSEAIFIEDGLFDAAGLTDDLTHEPDGGHGLRIARRILTLAWLYAGGTDGGPLAPALRAAIAWWAEHRPELRSWRLATLGAVLLQLEALRVVDTFSECTGGFHVKLREG